MYQGNNADIKAEYDNVRRILEKDIIEKKEVLILVSKASEWKYIENVWKKYKEEQDTEVDVAVLPYFYKEYDGSIKKEVNELGNFTTDIGAIDLAQYDIALHHPDIIYIQNPFDNENKAIGIEKKYYFMRSYLYGSIGSFANIVMVHRFFETGCRSSNSNFCFS